MDIKTIEQELFALNGNRQITYVSRVVPDSKPIIGVKIPLLRKKAKEIARDDYRTFLETCPDTYYEFETLQALVLGYARDDIETILEYADRFVPKIHDWAVNDSFCQTFTIARKHRERVWNWLMDYKEKQEEFPQRVVAIVLMSHFLEDEYVEKVLQIMNELNHPGYYTRMGVAWCVATAYAKYPEQTLDYLGNNRLADWTHNKAIQKMRESFRVPEADKEMLNQMKRK